VRSMSNSVIVSVFLLCFVASGVAQTLPEAVRSVANRPNVFKSRTYTPTPLPKFAETRSVLPHPVVEDHPEWETLYWKAWELAFQHLMQPMPESGFVSNFIDPAFNGNTFQWDSCFMLMYAHYAEPQFHAIGTLDNFYAKQHEDGYICREINRETGKDYQLGGIENTINPPLYSWVEWQNYLLTGDKSRFRDVLPPLIKYYAWIRDHHRRENGLYWNTGLGSGEDDLVRNATAYSWVDMTSQQAQNAYFIARIAEQIGERQVKEYFDDENKALSKLVTGTMWDAKTGFYYDLKRDGTETGIKTILGFWPMMAHIASAEQAASLVEHLQNPKEFWRPNLVPALAADEPGYSAEGQYWNGAVWAPTNYMVIKGLQDYGYEDLATKVTTIYLANMADSLEKSGTIWENYAPESSNGHGARDMVGWSADGPIALLIENVLGIRGFAATRSVTWRPRLAGENGIRNLTVGATHISLIASRLSDGKRKLTMTADQPISVTVDTGVGKPRTFRLKNGTVEAEMPGA
jgi:glycogen debranching enzyme